MDGAQSSVLLGHYQDYSEVFFKETSEAIKMGHSGASETFLSREAAKWLPVITFLDSLSALSLHYLQPASILCPSSCHHVYHVGGSLEGILYREPV